MIVRLGEYDLTKRSAQEIDHFVARIIKHPQYDRKPGLPHDLAILELIDRVIFTEFIRPVCLPTVNMVAEGKNVTVAGMFSILI